LEKLGGKSSLKAFASRWRCFPQQKQRHLPVKHLREQRRTLANLNSQFLKHLLRKRLIGVFWKTLTCKFTKLDTLS
jgi:hypothetical protein